mmetsp:Transcript_84350/g.257574  ORF Transcript_84350/g.257574 Transcript_84350/m.257574 type:complete len:231 (+) Transcript_84350:58-750(+)
MHLPQLLGPPHVDLFDGCVPAYHGLQHRDRFVPFLLALPLPAARGEALPAPTAADAALDVPRALLLSPRHAPHLAEHRNSARGQQHPDTALDFGRPANEARPPAGHDPPRHEPADERLDPDGSRVHLPQLVARYDADGVALDCPGRAMLPHRLADAVATGDPLDVARCALPLHAADVVRPPFSLDHRRANPRRRHPFVVLAHVPIKCAPRPLDPLRSHRPHIRGLHLRGL